MASKGRNIKLTSVDDLFSSEESRQEAQAEKVIHVPISEVSDFEKNPYRVKQDNELMEMVQSIKQVGVHTPCLARPKPDGGYELLSGHRRKLASTIAGVGTLPLIVREMDDDTATILVVDGNIQRETITFSEKARAYKMKLEAVKRKAGRPASKNYSQVGNNFETKTSIEEMAMKQGESKNQIYRYIRLTELVPPLLQMVDDKKMAFNPAVELSYLPEELQTELLDVIELEERTPSLSQAQRLKKAVQEGKLDRNGIELVLGEEKPQQNNFTIKNTELEKRYPPIKKYTSRQREELIYKALDLYFKRKERIKQERQQER